MQLLGMELAVGGVREWGGLAVFPLLGTARKEPVLASAKEAMAGGLLEVGELETPTVPTLVADNHGAVPVLLVEGEILVGAAQDRTLNVSVLCAPAAKTEIPVSCVEAGRWGGRGRRVEASSAHTSSKLRAAKLEAMQREDATRTSRRSDQGEVWRQVGAYAAANNVTSGTAALEDVNRARASALSGDLAELALEPGQIGLAIAGADGVLGVDLFDRPSILETHLKEILSGYAMDQGDVGLSTTLADVERFLEAVDRAGRVAQPGVGLGEELHLRSEDITGVGLSYEGQLVHLAAFPSVKESV